MPRLSFVDDDERRHCSSLQQLNHPTIGPQAGRPLSPILGRKSASLGMGASGLEAIMKRFPPRSDTLVSNLCETPPHSRPPQRLQTSLRIG